MEQLNDDIICIIGNLLPIKDRSSLRCSSKKIRLSMMNINIQKEVYIKKASDKFFKSSEYTKYHFRKKWKNLSNTSYIELISCDFCMFIRYKSSNNPDFEYNEAVIESSSYGAWLRYAYRVFNSRSQKSQRVIDFKHVISELYNS